MKGKTPAKGDRGGRRAARRRRRSRGALKLRSPWRRHMTPIKMGISLGVVALGIALLLSPKLRNGRVPIITGEQPGVSTLLPAPLGTKVPINDVDPVTGRPIEPSSPTLVYKGYIIAFCCEKSSGYNGDWVRMSEAEKDAFVRQCLNSRAPILTGEQPGVSTLLPAPLGTKVPINDIDPVTGRPIEPSSPTLVYNGYTIAFCCEKSSGYNGDWVRMSKAEKDAFVRQCLK